VDILRAVSFPDILIAWRSMSIGDETGATCRLTLLICRLNKHAVSHSMSSCRYGRESFCPC